LIREHVELPEVALILKTRYRRVRDVLKSDHPSKEIQVVLCKVNAK